MTLLLFCFCCLFLCFKTGSHIVALAGLELEILLPLSPKYALRIKADRWGPAQYLLEMGRCLPPRSTSLSSLIPWSLPVSLFLLFLEP